MARWASYLSTHAVTDYQRNEVEKALCCYGFQNGCYVHYCSHCDQWIFQSLGCNSRICSSCGKRYADQWSESLSQTMFPVPHRHFVLSVPDALWSSLRDWSLLKVYMDAAILSLNDYFSHKTHQQLKVGAIIVLHPFGKDMKFYPHLHILLTEGGFDKKGHFVPCSYVPAAGFRKTWQYHALTQLKRHGVASTLVQEMFSKYRQGFYVWLHKRGRITHPRLISRYVGRYVRHPAIANSRIVYFDGDIVKFFYLNHDEIRVTVTMTADQFISALIQHIPPPQFKMIRHYGAYARRVKGKFGAKAKSSIKQLNLFAFGVEKTKYCPFCHHPMDFVIYCKKKPPDPPKIQRVMLDWISVNATEICHRR